jgi:hypothetical protein
MLGFKRFDTAAVTISGIELAAKIRKHQSKSPNCPADRRRFQQSEQLWPPSNLKAAVLPCNLRFPNVCTRTVRHSSGIAAVRCARVTTPFFVDCREV